MWDPVPGTPSMTQPPLKTTPAKFEGQVRYVRNLQRAGKGFFAINEWGAGPDYGLNPGAQPYNITGASEPPMITEAKVHVFKTAPTIVI